ncbi:hypothetical protein BH23GEM6_BH23GEM6_23400 [soil metagenome]
MRPSQTAKAASNLQPQLFLPSPHRRGRVRFATPAVFTEMPALPRRMNFQLLRTYISARATGRWPRAQACRPHGGAARPGLLLSFLTGLAVTGMVAAPSAAQQAGDGPTVTSDGRPSVRAVRTQTPPRIDGVPDEDAWAAAVPITRFIQVDPEEGQPVSQPTRVAILYDDAALYVAAWLYDEYPVSTRLARRDSNLSDSDWFSIALDSYLDRRTGFRLRVNPSGVRFDQALSRERERGGDNSWDPVWQVATEVTDSGWTVEMRIPFHQLRFRPAEVQTWGLQLEREIARRQERAVFAFTPRSEQGGISRFANLTDLRGVRPGGRWEALPYVVARAASAQEEPGNPFQDGRAYGSGLGMDVTYRVTGNLTLNAALNPDFGQVEGDPAEVNLSVFETRVGERRPFFVEGSEIFRFGGRGPQFFYSRRIGRAPQVRSISNAVHVDMPDAATILAAAKLTGKTQNGWSIGAVNAVTNRAMASFVDASGTLEQVEVEPRSNHLVARVRREMRGGETTAGGLFTAANRDVSEARIRSNLHSAAYILGADFTHQWSDRTWALESWMGLSHVRGTPGAMIGLQRSPSRYYQRPDALYLSFDTASTSLTGSVAGLEIEKQAGEHWRGDVGILATTPGFEVNDLGFGRRSDRIESYGTITYREDEPGDILRSWRLDLSPDVAWNFGRDYLGASAQLRARAELLSYWSGTVGVQRSFAGMDDRLTRGGPLARSPTADRFFASFASDPREALVGEASGQISRDEAGGWARSLGMGANYRPAPNWNVSVSPRYARERTAAQYLATVADPLATETFGQRYLFAELERTTLSILSRLNFTFTPQLTLEVLAEPFLANGDYGVPMQLASPGTFDFIRFGRDAGSVHPTEDRGYRVDPDGGGPAEPFTLRNRDFRTGSLRGNAVLRWEWRPGSTLYLVWQQDRSSREPEGRFRLGTGLQDLWAEAPANVLMLKMSYWFNG